MPKGKREKLAEAPDKARCDFCAGVFPPTHWQQRTCVRCAVAGCPDQSKPGYDKAFIAWQQEHGRLKDDPRSVSGRIAAANRA